MPKILNPYLAPYAGESLEQRKKVRLLVQTCFAGMVAAFLFAVAKAVLAFDLLNLVMAVVMIAAAAISLALTRRKHYIVATNLLMCVLSIGFFLLDFMKPFTDRAILYEYGLYCAFLLVSLCLIALRATQMAIFSGAYLLGIVSLYVFRATPAAASSGVAVGMVDLAGVLVFVSLTGLLCWLVLSQLGSTIRQAEAESAENKRRAEEVSAIVRGLQDSLESGSGLVHSSGQAVEALGVVKQELAGIEKAAREQDGGIQASRRRGAELSTDAAAMKRGMANHDAAIVGATGKIGDIASSMRGLSTLAGEGRGAMERLVESAGSGEKEMSASIAAIVEAERASADVLSSVGVIGDIADRTGLLAMNAAIEAARAGQAGKGFAIVSGEIRGLSEETNRNAVHIAEIIKVNAAATTRALDISKRAQDAFHRISTEVDETHADVLRIESGLESAAKEVEGLSGELTSIAGALSDVAGLVTRVEGTARVEDGDLENIAAMSRGIVDRSASMVGQFDKLASSIAAVDGVGRKTMALMERVDTEMRSLDSHDAKGEE